LTISHCGGPSLMLAYAVAPTPMAADAYDASSLPILAKGK
jgi:hypothetical protein